MSKRITKKHIWMPLGAALAVTLPVALSIACGKDTTPTTSQPALTVEQTAQANLARADDVTDNEMLYHIRAVVKAKANVANVSVASYLADNSPRTWPIEDYIYIFISGMASAWRLREATSFFTIDKFAELVSDLQINSVELFTRMKLAVDNFAPSDAVVTNVWDTFTKTFVEIFNPSKNYEALIKFFTGGATPLFSQSAFNNLNTVLSTRKYYPSGVKTVYGGNIYGFDGTSILNTTATAAV